MASEDEADTEDQLSQSQEMSRDLHAILQDLQGNLSGLVGSVLVDESGLPLAWDLKGGADPTIIATAGALITRAGERTSETLDYGNMRTAVLTTDKGTVAIFRVTTRIALVTLLQPSTNNILAIVEVNKALDRFREVIAPGY